MKRLLCVMGLHRWEFLATIDARFPRSLVTRVRCRRSQCGRREWMIVDVTSVPEQCRHLRAVK